MQTRFSATHFKLDVTMRLMRVPKAYRYVIVESFRPDSTAGRHGPVHVRPIPGQVYDPSLNVSHSAQLIDTERYPVGTKFKIWATLTSREGKGRYLYSDYRDAATVVTNQEAQEFINGLKKGHI